MRPFSSTCADWAGKNVLKTPMGRLPMPGAMVSTKGSRQSYQVRSTRSAAVVTASTTVERGSPARANCAPMTGSDTSAKAG